MRKLVPAETMKPADKRRPALSPEARENQLISLAVDLAEQQLQQGTASSQVITHYLKLGSSKERIEKEILEKQKILIDAKTQQIQSSQKIEELYANALSAMQQYSGKTAVADYD
jgi:EAL domain-containing protein (putative c-di-GMP-specific phosphodiesterase class I)